MNKGIWIVDVDGTLLRKSEQAFLDHGEDRAWYIPRHDDILIEPVAHMVRGLYAMDFGIVLLTARKEEDRQVTELVLKNKVPYSHLFMRENHDDRADQETKVEILARHVTPLLRAYSTSIMGIIEDRPKVVKQWRELGYFVVDVNQRAEDF